MDIKLLRTYARGARHDFYDAVAARARKLGLFADRTLEATTNSDVLRVGTQAFPISIARPRLQLAQRMRRDGYHHVLEEMAYTWFNRLVAIRFMELRGYFGHGLRVLSHPDEYEQPEVMHHIGALTLPGLDRGQAIIMKLEGTQDEALYRDVLLAQCRALRHAVPQLFAHAQEESALLLPDHLLRSDSVVARLVTSIPESAWQDIEIVGWLYQFYISERKDEVMGTVVSSDDIPAATQLFTPNWIVKYLVHNSLGALWSSAHHTSSLPGKMSYYVPPASAAHNTSVPPPNI